MSASDPSPWLRAAIGLLDVRRHDRLCACGIDVGTARELAAKVGRDGALTAVLQEPLAARALAALDLPQVTVLAHQLTGDERFGTFDALLVAPRHGPLPGPGALCDLARANLRPGGRVVFDVPGARMVPDLLAALPVAGIDPERGAPWCGLADDTLAEALRNGGLRNVHAVLGSHLLHTGSPADLVDQFAPGIGLTGDDSMQLTHALTRQKGGTGPIDALVHRTRVLALR
jgi:hypothetical protein